MKIAIGSDHAGFLYKEQIIQRLKSLGHEVKDMGTYSEETVDYPLFIRPVAEAVARGEMPSIRVGRRYLVPVAALDKLLAEASSRRFCELCQQPVPAHKVFLHTSNGGGLCESCTQGK